MEIEYHWFSHADPEYQKHVEFELSEILNHMGFNPCHPGSLAISLGIGGPLDHILTGSVKCQCGKVLMTFKGDESAANMEFTEIE